MFSERGASEFRVTYEPVTQPDRAYEPSGFIATKQRRSGMPNHLTPEELSKEMGIDRQEVIRVCMQEGVPIYRARSTRRSSRLSSRRGLRPPEALAS